MQFLRPNIVLIGMMGTGKTSVGEWLSRHTGWSLKNTDDLIVERAAMTIPDMFAKHGESYFRGVEEEVIEAVMKNDNQIVATGGGAVLRQANCNRMRERGYVVALRASAETIWRRVREDENRPLLSGNTAGRIECILQERKHAYDFADFTIDTDGRTILDIAERILKQVEA